MLLERYRQTDRQTERESAHAHLCVNTETYAPFEHPIAEMFILH